MTRTPEIDVNPAVLAWVRDAAGWTLDDAAKHAGVDAERYRRWENGDSRPTLAQVRSLANRARKPLAFFLLPEAPPTGAQKPPDFRGGGGPAPSSVLREIAKAEARREAFLDLAADAPATSLPRTLDAPGARALLDLTVSDINATPDTRAALRLWMRAVEDQGVLVFHMSRVAVQECRAVSISHDEYPIVVLNGADSPAGRIFSLLHELAHIIERTGGICGHLEAGAERRCNRFAAQVLMPTDAVLGLVETPGTPDHWVDAVSRRFRVSRHAAAIRLADLGILGREDIPKFIDNKQSPHENTGGPAHHVLMRRNLGEPFIRAVLDAHHRDEITVAHTAYYLETQARNIPRFEEAGIRK